MKELFKIVKFAGAGLVSTVIEVLFFYVLQQFVKLDSGWCFLISAIVGYALAYLLNRKYTFKAGKIPLYSIVAYVIMVIFTVLATTWLGVWITGWFVSQGMRRVGETITKPLVAVLAIVWTYPINRFVIHPVRGLKS